MTAGGKLISLHVPTCPRGTISVLSLPAEIWHSGEPPRVHSAPWTHSEAWGHSALTQHWPMETPVNDGRDGEPLLSVFTTRVGRTWLAWRRRWRTFWPWAVWHLQFLTTSGGHQMPFRRGFQREGAANRHLGNAGPEDVLWWIPWLLRCSSSPVSLGGYSWSPLWQLVLHKADNTHLCHKTSRNSPVSPGFPLLPVLFQTHYDDFRLVLSMFMRDHDYHNSS